MKRFKLPNTLKSYFQITELELIVLYIKAVEQNPRWQGLSQSVYQTIIAIKILEKLDRDWPTQPEIDCIELFVKRCAKKKLGCGSDIKLENVA